MTMAAIEKMASAPIVPTLVRVRGVRKRARPQMRSCFARKDKGWRKGGRQGGKE